jgi:hypothetical protein
LSNTEFNTSALPTFGITALIGSKSPSSIFGFQSGLAYTEGKHKGVYTYSQIDLAGYDITQVSTTTINYSMLSISAGLRMSVRSNKLNPYFSLGMSSQQFLSLDENVHQVTTINSSVEEEEFSLDMGKSSFGLWGAAGLKKKIGSNKALFVECNYQHSYLASSPQSAKLTGTSFRIGFMF